MQKHDFFCSKIWECSTFQPLYLKAPFSPEVVIHSVFNTYFTEYLIQTRICGRHPGDSNPQKRTSPSSSEAYCLKRKKINTQHQVMMNALRDWNPRGSIIVWILTVLQRCICCWRDCLEMGPTEGSGATEGVILKGILALQALFYPSCPLWHEEPPPHTPHRDALYNTTVKYLINTDCGAMTLNKPRPHFLLPT